MKVLIAYLIWTFLSMALLKSGLQLIIGTSVGYIPMFLICLHIQILIIFPILLFIANSIKD